MPTLPAAKQTVSHCRRLLRRITPLRWAWGWSTGLWGDLRLYLLTQIGDFPSHVVRNFWYRRAGVKLPKTSSIHWKARFFAP